MNISIFGLGYVGCVSMGCLAQNGHKVIGVDVNDTKIDLINRGLPTIVEKDVDKIIAEQHKKGNIYATQNYREAILNTEISIICVGTPSTQNGHLNLEHIFSVAKQIGEVLKDKDEFHIVAIRSTVKPGTNQEVSRIIEEESNKKRNIHFAVLSNPEFLREGSAVYDYYNPPYTLIGHDNINAAKKLSELYSSIPAEIIFSEIKVAEIIKYVNNSFHALKVSFANEIGNICKALNIDSYEVMNIFMKDNKLNISPYYFKPGFAFGGSCLPKDLKGIKALAHDLYLDVPIINNIENSNNVQIKRAVDLLISIDKKNIGFLGISFKKGTDDLRNSPTIEVIEQLIGKGYHIKLFDKNVNLSRLTGANKEYIQMKIKHLEKLMVESVDLVVKESDVIVITQNEPEFKHIAQNEEDKIIVDFVRIDENIIGRKNYYGINW